MLFAELWEAEMTVRTAIRKDEWWKEDLGSGDWVALREDWAGSAGGVAYHDVAAAYFDIKWMDVWRKGGKPFPSDRIVEAEGRLRDALVATADGSFGRWRRRSRALELFDEDDRNWTPADD
jgi:hypothetical protein